MVTPSIFHENLSYRSNGDKKAVNTIVKQLVDEISIIFPSLIATIPYKLVKFHVTYAY